MPGPPLWFSLPVAGLLSWVLFEFLAKHAKPRASSSGAPGVATGRVTRTAVENRPYFVMSLGGGVYEVRREDAPDVWLILDQGGERQSSGEKSDLELLRTDMRQFPSSLFDDVRVAGFLDFESPSPAESLAFTPAWYRTLTYDPRRRAWSWSDAYFEANPARAQVRAPFGSYVYRWLTSEKRWVRTG